MVTPTISPPEAENDGCSASADFLRREDYNTGTPNYFCFEYYKLSATSVGDWRFKHFEVTQRYVSLGVEHISDFTTVDNPKELVESTGHSDPYYDSYYLKVCAVFEHVVKVATSVYPENAGTSTGDGDYDSGSSVTISTKEKCSPWIFDHWELNPGGVIARSKEHSFTVDEDTDCIAYYKHTNTLDPYHDENGNVLCSGNGAILYDGDAI